jgi:uncharacterized membrane protein
MSVVDLWSRRPLFAGRWTIKDVVQGKPLRHPSHPLFVHFPSALFPAALLFDVISRIDADLTFTRAAFYNISLGLGVATLAAITGLVDYLPMVGGSTKKRLGTYHLIGQAVSVSCFSVSLVIRAFDFDATQTSWPALLFAAAGAAALAVGNYFGGSLVYRQGMRVSVDL